MWQGQVGLHCVARIVSHHPNSFLTIILFLDSTKRDHENAATFYRTSAVDYLFGGTIMPDLQAVIDEARPMLEVFLHEIGLHCGGPLDFPRLLDPFSSWVDTQEVTEDDWFYLSSRLAAFICEYLIDVCSAERVIANGRILMRVSIQEGILREFDPYAVAVGMATNRNSLKAFLDTLCS